jgi:tetratricopeptide (TPR) repeat protein
MKKIWFTLGLALVLGCNILYAAEAGKDKVISEIGSLVNAQKYQIALTKCNAALQKYPQEAFLYYWRGSIENSTGNRQAALADLNKSILLDETNAKAFILRGIVKSELGDNEGALEDINKAIELDSNDSAAYSMRACIKLDMGEFDSANEDLDMANKLINSKQEEK